MNAMKCFLISVLFFCLASTSFWGCPHRNTGEINVDEIQGYVDDIDMHFKKMDQALAKKDIKEAYDEFEEVEDITEDHQSELAAYPEATLLKERVTEARDVLCFSAVDFALKRFFKALKDKNVSTAESAFDDSRSQFKRCYKIIKDRDDFMALEINVKSGPDDIKKLKEELRIRALRKEMMVEQAGLVEKIKGFDNKMAALKKNPKQKDLAMSVKKNLFNLLKLVSKKTEFDELKEWKQFTNQSKKKLQEADADLGTLIFQGKTMWVIQDVLIVADKEAKKAARTKDMKAARQLWQSSVDRYGICVTNLKKDLARNRTLSRKKFSYDGRKKSVSWLFKHCKRKKQLLEQTIDKLDKKAARLKKQKEKPDPKVKKPKKEKKKPKKKKAKKPRGRIRRW